MELTIRPETGADVTTIHHITKVAFSDMPYAGGDEQDLVDLLRAEGALTLSLVAVDNGEIVGQVTFSPAKNSDGSEPWFALGPVSVMPSRQGEGIGARMILEGLHEITKLGALGCILTGNPAYYQRFGFALSPQTVPANESAEYFMVKLLKGEMPTGTFSFHYLFYSGDE